MPASFAGSCAIVALAVQSIGRTLVLTFLATAFCERPKIQQQCPATQAALRTRLVAVQAAACVQQAVHAIHRPIHRIARAPAPRVSIRQRIIVRPLP